MDHPNLTPDTTFPYRLFRFAHKRSLDAVSSSYFAVVSKDSAPVGLVLTIDIPERWHHAKEAATAFWQIYVREFTHSESRSTLTRFEEALKELNKAVVKAQEKIQEPISVAAVILEDSQINFSTIGTCRILLVRSGIFSDVTAGADKAGNQFAAVTSGDIDGNDTVCVTNQNLYEFLAAEPNELWDQSTIEQLAAEIQSRAQNSANSLNLVLLQYSTDHSGQATLYWEESEKRYPISWPKFNWPSLPRLTWPNRPKLAWPKLALPNLAAIKQLPLLLKNFKRPPFQPVRATPSSLPRAESRGVEGPPRRLQIAGAALVILIGLIWVWQRPNPNESPPPTQSISERLATVAVEDSVSFLRDYVTEIVALSSDSRSQFAETLLNRGIELTSLPELITEVPNRIVEISPADNSLFMVDETGQLWELPIGGQLKQIDHLFKVSQPTGLAAFSATSLAISDGLGNIWHYRGEASGPVAVSLSAALTSVTKKIAKFSNNLYIYSAEPPAIFRASNFAGEITATAPYNTPTVVNNATIHDFAVNGDFIAITDGQIVSWRRNETTRSSLPYLFAKAYSRIDATEGGIIVLQTDNLITVISPTNEVIWQRYFAGGRTIGSIAIIGDDIWFTANGGVYNVTL
ncbi:MAG: hypothetical protein WEC83_02205 [Patescibacteria group bacterium]